MIVKLSPLDTVFFKDGKPFTAGAETWGNTIFPPMPSTFYGTIGTWFLSNKGITQQNVNQVQTSLKIKGIFLMINDTLYLPAPLDLIIKNKNFSASPLEMGERRGFSWNCELSNIVFDREHIQIPLGFIIDAHSFSQYLKGESTNFNLKRINDYIIQEPKVGIKRSRKTLSAEEGHLYTINMIRIVKKLSFAIDVEGLDIPDEEAIVRFGAEGKTAKIEKLSDYLIEEFTGNNIRKQIAERIKQKRRFKLVLLTPAVFENGWADKWMLNGSYRDLRIKLLSCVIGKPVSFGGWDLSLKQPKTMFRYVPAGSVYYFQLQEDSRPEDVIETFHYRSISIDKERKRQEGFCIVFVGC